MFYIIRISGGLGNQMFIYSFTISLKKEYYVSIIWFDILDSLNLHNGYELSRIFNAHKIYGASVYRGIRKIYSTWPTKIFFKWIKEKNPFSYDNKIKDNKYYPFAVYDGFWQSELYFRQCEKEIREKFRFNHDLLNIKSQNLLQFIKEHNSVSIHFRRGDYLNIENTKSHSIEYYLKAIDYIERKVHKPVFHIFSDDIDWVKSNFILKDAYYVDWNKEKDNWQDMCLMSACKHNIIANSTFSWWGAWLNENPDKIVIAPKYWMRDTEESDVIPVTWIKM